MEIKIMNREETEWRTAEWWSVLDDNGTPVSSAGVMTTLSRFGKDWMNTNLVGGVNTPPEHRRRGYVRMLMNEVADKAPDYGWNVSLLHPFSFAYYRQFGYERVGDHRILTFPMRALEFIPRYKDLVPLGDKGPQAIALYNEWTAGRNLSLRRASGLFNQDCFGDHGSAVFCDMDGDRMRGYVALRVENHLVINHMEGDLLHVNELVYEDRDTLLRLMGFLRMFDGQDDMVRIHNCAMAPEIELTLRHYTHTEIKVLPDIMAKILDLPGMLSYHVWPKEHGAFLLQVEDTLPRVGGLWQVEYENGEAQVTAAKSGSPCLTMTSAALVPVLYGFEDYSEEMLRYAPGSQVNGNVDDFVRAFPKQNCGLYEHF